MKFRNLSAARIASIGLLVTLARFVHIITMQDRIGSVLTGGGAMSNYIRLRDLTRKERRILNRIVRRQRREVRRR